MGQRKPSFFSLMSCTLLGLISCAGIVQAEALIIDADNLGRMTIDFNNATFDAAVVSGTLGAAPDQYLYCVDLNTGLVVDSANPTAYSAQSNGNGTVASLGGLVTNADAIAWLVNNYTPSALNDALALQAAIWKVEYGNAFALDAGGNTQAETLTAYNTLITLIGTSPSFNYSAPLSSATWISPAGPSPYPFIAQGLVAPGHTVPEPGTIFLALLGIVGASAISRVRTRDTILRS